MADPNYEIKRRWRRKNLAKHNETNRLWRQNNPDYYRKYMKSRRQLDVNFRLIDNLRHRLWSALTGNFKSGSAIEDLGCTIDQLKSWIMYQFQPGMTWENYGEWHIDHVKPLSSFDLTTREQILKACNWYNLQPLWAKDNLRKGNTDG